MKLKVSALLGAVALIALAAPACAQPIQYQASDGYNNTPVSAANPLPVTATISATNPSVGTNGAAVPTSSTLTAYQNGSGNTVQDSTATPHPVVDSALATLAAQGVGTTAAAVPAQAIYMGCRAATAQPTAVTDGQLVGPMCGTGGQQVVTPYAPAAFRVSGTATGTDTAAHSIIASAGGSLKNYITGVQCGRSDAGTSPIVLTFSDASSSIMILPNGGNGGASNMVFLSPLATAAATAFTFTSGTSTSTVYCNAQGFQAP